MTLSRRQLIKAALGTSLLASVPLLSTSVFATDSEAATLPLTIHTKQGPHRLDVEVAETVAQRQQGLMGREHLPEARGMLFRFEREQPANNAFWMYKTLIPLDIAFIDGEGRIVAINTMPPCESDSPRECPAYPAGAAYRSALEVNAGYFEARGIQVGDCVSVPALAGFCRGGD
ncbi:DUF192 domain-containing protein [Vreelandella malpeensis]|uniref:DUF192 domain-containing protein n=1 Tax=Vreelandella malpeensis TaxID=1172368 RepID=A0ABS8DNW6_9GAMM|nr:DUF192 domain-containing protein [Halomonas malpeensis]MCB8887986.1 DUF192 domain-containing protein [Halomonas malpeensis]